MNINEPDAQVQEAVPEIYGFPMTDAIVARRPRDAFLDMHMGNIVAGYLDLMSLLVIQTFVCTLGDWPSHAKKIRLREIVRLLGASSDDIADFCARHTSTLLFDYAIQRQLEARDAMKHALTMANVTMAKYVWYDHMGGEWRMPWCLEQWEMCIVDAMKQESQPKAMDIIRFTHEAMEGDVDEQGVLDLDRLFGPFIWEKMIETFDVIHLDEIAHRLNIIGYNESSVFETAVEAGSVPKLVFLLDRPMKIQRPDDRYDRSFVRFHPLALVKAQHVDMFKYLYDRGSPIRQETLCSLIANAKVEILDYIQTLFDGHLPWQLYVPNFNLHYINALHGEDVVMRILAFMDNLAVIRFEVDDQWFLYESYYAIRYNFLRILEWLLTHPMWTRSVKHNLILYNMAHKAIQNDNRTERLEVLNRYVPYPAPLTHIPHAPEGAEG
jgi:hypothetical protein